MLLSVQNGLAQRYVNEEVVIYSILSIDISKNLDSINSIEHFYILVEPETTTTTSTTTTRRGNIFSDSQLDVLIPPHSAIFELSTNFMCTVFT